MGDYLESGLSILETKYHRAGLAALLASGAVPLVAFSQVYLTEDQALKAIFPAEKLTKKTVELSAEDAERIEQRSGEKVRNRSLTAWVSPAKSVIFVDQVLGKHEFITFAVGITKERKVKSVEIMEYRETYGSDVRKDEWRKQFEGKDSTATLKAGQDIINISGATLSSAHVSAGVRRILQTYEAVRDRL